MEKGDDDDIKVEDVRRSKAREFEKKENEGLKMFLYWEKRNKHFSVFIKLDIWRFKLDNWHLIFGKNKLFILIQFNFMAHDCPRKSE